MAAPDGNLPPFPWRRVLPGMIAGVALFFLFLQSLTTTLAWWRGTLAQPDVWDWLWIGFMPVCLFVYIRYFSIFRAECRACEPPAEHTDNPS